MRATSYFTSFLSEHEIWPHLENILQKYDSVLAEKYIVVTEALSNADEDTLALIQAYRIAITSDALFAFGKGMDANLYHFRNPCDPMFTQADLCDLYQEHIMRSMPKRKEAEQMIATMEAKSFQGNPTLGEAFREFFVDLEVVIPKIMHFEGYLAANDWLHLSIPGYQEDQKLTTTYHSQITAYFGL